MVHVRGGDRAVAPLLQLADRCGWYMLDSSQPEWLHHASDVEAGWRSFQEFRDSRLGGAGPTGEPPVEPGAAANGGA
jgi:hypothetical protein